MFLRPLSFSLALLLTTAPVFAQTAPTPPAVTPTTTPREAIEGTLSQERTVIGIPPLATASVQTVAGLRTDSLGRQIAEVIAADLERSGLYEPIGPNGVRAITRAENVVHGFVDAGSNGRLIVGFSLYATALGSSEE